MSSDGNKPSFEALIGRLEVVVGKLESDDLSLEAAIDAYQEGVRLAKEGHDRLGEAERRIEEVTKAGSTTEIEPAAILGADADGLT